MQQMQNRLLRDFVEHGDILYHLSLICMENRVIETTTIDFVFPLVNEFSAMIISSILSAASATFAFISKIGVPEIMSQSTFSDFQTPIQGDFDRAEVAKMKRLSHLEKSVHRFSQND